MAALKVAVVSFDGQSAPFAGTKPLVGRAVEQAARQQAEIRKGVIGFEVHDPAEFNYDPISVRQAVFDEHFWAGIVVNNNATTLLQQAVSEGNRTYDPLGAMQVVYVQARDETTYANYITPQLNQFTTNVQARFGEQWITQILANTSLEQATYSQAPQALSPAIGVSIYNLRPFGPPQATPAVTIGLIYLIIIAFFNFSFVSLLRLLLGKPTNTSSISQYTPNSSSHRVILRCTSTSSSYGDSLRLSLHIFCSHLDTLLSASLSKFHSATTSRTTTSLLLRTPTPLAKARFQSTGCSTSWACFRLALHPRTSR